MSGFLTGTADCQLPREADVIDIDRIKAYGRDELFELAAALRSLADDLQLLGSGTMPASEMTEAAPRLDAWALAFRPQPCLVGQRCGHPRLCQDGRTTITSGLWAISERFGVARTQSRWYRLGGARADAGVVDA